MGNSFRKIRRAMIIIGLFFIALFGLTGLSSQYGWTQSERTIEMQVPFLGPEEGKLTVCKTSATGEVTCGGIAHYIVVAYQWVIGFAMILAVLMLTFAGLVWMTAHGDISQVKKAHRIIRNALIGLSLAIGSYLFLYILNPDLVKLPDLALRGVKKIDLPIIHGIQTCDKSKLKYSPGISTGTFTSITFDNDAKTDMEGSGKVVQEFAALLQQIDTQGFDLKIVRPPDKHPEHLGIHMGPILAADFTGPKEELSKLETYIKSNAVSLKNPNTYIFENTEVGKTRHVGHDCEQIIKASGGGPTR